MKHIFVSEPYNKEDILLALEYGVETIIVAEEHRLEVESFARITVIPLEKVVYISVQKKEDELYAISCLKEGKVVVIRHGFEIIPLENIISHALPVYVEVKTIAEKNVAYGILECGVAGIVCGIEHIALLCERTQGAQKYTLSRATITGISHAGMGDRVCVDTTSLWHTGEGMLVGNSAGFFFVVQAETEYNEYVAPRPFRVNAGSVHNYIMCPDDTTRYLSEVTSGEAVLACSASGETRSITVGRSKVERRPMLMITAECEGKEGIVFVQNAETIALLSEEGTPCSVVRLRVGDTILVHLDTAGRHFGIRIDETIQE